MCPLALYNTLSRRVEPFEPLDPPRVTVYMCGPTLWNHAHLGNFRTFLFGDLLRRYLRYVGYDVFFVMNLTDVDDRTIRAAQEAGVTLHEHTQPFLDAFFADLDYLRIERAHVYPRATAYIGPMIELVGRLIDRGLAYQGDDGSVYFAVAQFATYGRLSQVHRRQLKAGARVASDEYSKEDVRDFAVWKAAAPDDEAVGAAWDAPFGRGRPGWHLECSAMSLGEIDRRFGVETLDIHAGGVDLIFPHHENEIAQSEGATGCPFARFWLHGEFLNIQGTKMSKRFGNILTARDLQEEGIDPAAFRLLAFSTHYRQQLSFTDEALASATEGVGRLGDFRQRLAAAALETDTVTVGEMQGEPTAALPAVAQLRSDFPAALDDDLNAPRGSAAIFNFVRSANRELDASRWTPDQARAALAAFDDVVAVLDVLPSRRDRDFEVSEWVEAKIAERRSAREAGNYAKADAIRAEVAGRGIELEDTPGGTRWRQR